MDLEFKLSEDKLFNARSCAFIYNKDKTKILLFKGDDRDYYMLPGGKINFDEDSFSSIKREILEEVGYEIDFSLIGIQENFLKKDNTFIMQYAFCYEGIYLGNDFSSFKCLDNN